MHTILIFAGLPSVVNQHIRAVSSNRFVPNGDLIRNQVGQEGYTEQYADVLKAVAHALIRKKAEDKEISVILGFIDYASEKTRLFVRSFFSVCPAATASSIRFRSIVWKREPKK